MSKPIACVLFDYGSVVSQPLALDARRKQAGLAGLDFPDFRRLWGQYRMSYDQGIIDGQEYWSRILAHSRLTARNGLIDQLILADIESWRPTVDWILDWAMRLRDSGVQTGVLSNMPPDLTADLRKMDWIENFGPLFFSAEIKEIKPYGPIYAHVISNLPCPTSETLFIDDRADNVRGALRAGLNTIIHKSRDETRRLVEAGFDIPLP